MKQKINKVIELLKKEQLAAILISCPLNIVYLTNIDYAEGYLILDKEGKAVFFTSPLYDGVLKSTNMLKVIIAYDGIFKALTQYIFLQKYKNIGFEANNLSFNFYTKLNAIFNQKKLNFTKTTNIIENLRAIKTPEEIAYIQKAINITLEAIEYSKEIINSNMSEKSLSIEIERFMRIKGDNNIAFPTIVANGKNSTYPHHFPTENKLKNNVLLIDLGAKYKSYCADLTRTFFWGKMPPLFKKMHALIQKSSDLTINKIKAGIKISEIDKFARSFIEKKGLGKYFIHGIGHGIGLAVHEEPSLNSKNDDILKEGMVITIEPAIYIPNKFGIRIEEVVLVKKDRGEILSNGGSLYPSGKGG